jgi:hypothetical protein
LLLFEFFQAIKKAANRFTVSGVSNALVLAQFGVHNRWGTVRVGEGGQGNISLGADGKYNLKPLLHNHNHWSKEVGNLNRTRPPAEHVLRSKNTHHIALHKNMLLHSHANVTLNSKASTTGLLWAEHSPSGQKRHLWKCNDAAWIPGCRPAESLWLWNATLHVATNTPATKSLLRIEHAYRNLKTDVDRPGKSWLVHFLNINSGDSERAQQMHSHGSLSLDKIKKSDREKQQPREERVAFLKLAGFKWIKPKAPKFQANEDFTADGPSSKWFPRCSDANGTDVKSHIRWVGEFRHVFAEMFAMHVDRVLGL